MVSFRDPHSASESSTPHRIASPTNPSPHLSLSSHSDMESNPRGSERFSSASGGYSARDSVHLIPSIVDNKAQKFHPLALRLPIAIGVPIVMFGLGVALEIALAVSERDNGFAVPKDNVIGFASAQFLLAFVPTVLIIPVAYLWRELDWYVRQYQPYVLLSRGNASADETLLNDYVGVGVAGAIINAFKFKHRVVFFSAYLAFISYTLQPLAGSIFQLQQRGQPQSTNVKSTKKIGLSPDISELIAFVSSAGFVEAAVYNGLQDPPFIQGGWATAEFEFEFPPNNFLNGSMVVNTTGIQTKHNCTQPKAVQVTQSTTSNFTITSTSTGDCTVNVPFNPSLAAQQYGVADASCGSDPNLNVTFRPVMFWYFHQNERDGTPEARTVFCAPFIKAFNVQATTSLNNGSLTNVTGLGEYAPSNNVMGGEFAGKAFNGLLFQPTNNPFIDARSLATRAGVPAAIFRAVSQQKGGLQATFDQPNGFLDITARIYTQHLSLSAKAIYFIKESTILPANMVSLLPRLVINTIPGHALAITMMLIGIIGLFVQIVHRRQRKQLFLAAPPGTIAATMALSSHSGFGQLLMPYDNEETLYKKLSNLRFHMDKRTGALVADDQPPSMAKMKKERDEAMQALLGEHKSDTRDFSSSQVAFDAASGYPPWQMQYKTPYDPEH
ncbi:hypothetical protein L218DRAFT_955685 [Marasmius fiardii PR-910]|nr:hypothetical protein L218DRAFT_955685 [Marasmius fiardii PR-910]